MNRALVFALLYVAAYIFLEWVTDVRPLLTPGITPVLLLGTVVGERERAAEQLRERDAALARAMRFAVAGELASALANKLNQPITAPVSYLRASEILAGGSVGADDRIKATLGTGARISTRPWRTCRS